MVILNMHVTRDQKIKGLAFIYFGCMGANHFSNRVFIAGFEVARRPLATRSAHRVADPLDDLAGQRLCQPRDRRRTQKFSQNEITCIFGIHLITMFNANPKGSKVKHLIFSMNVDANFFVPKVRQV